MNDNDLQRQNTAITRDKKKHEKAIDVKTGESKLLLRRIQWLWLLSKIKFVKYAHTHTMNIK